METIKPATLQNPSLVDLHRIKKAFHDNNGLLPAVPRAMEIQQNLGFPEHSVRAFLSGAIKKQMGLRVQSSQSADANRAYRVSDK